MANAKINKLTNANLYLNGNSLLGRVAEFDIPMPTYKQAEHVSLGMFGSSQFPAGMEQLEARLKWTSFYQDGNAQLMNPFTSANLQLRGNLETYESAGRTAQVPYTCFMIGNPKDVDLGKFKAHENAEFEVNLAITYIKLEVEGVAVFEVDVLANVFKINGIDALATYRANLGV